MSWTESIWIVKKINSLIRGSSGSTVTLNSLQTSVDNVTALVQQLIDQTGTLLDVGNQQSEENNLYYNKYSYNDGVSTELKQYVLFKNSDCTFDSLVSYEQAFNIMNDIKENHTIITVYPGPDVLDQDNSLHLLEEFTVVSEGDEPYIEFFGQKEDESTEEIFSFVESFIISK